MKKSELFKEIYRTVRAVNNNIGDAYDFSVIRPELIDQETDLKLKVGNAEFVSTAHHWHSSRMVYVLAVSLTELLSKTFKIENDIDLNELDTVENLASEVEQEEQ